MAHRSHDLTAIQTALDNIKSTWKTTTKAMYAQGEQGQEAAIEPQAAAQGDDVQDVDYEEVK